MSSGFGSIFSANRQSPAKASHRQGLIVMGEKQIEAYLLARDALRRVRAAAATSMPPRPRGGRGQVRIAGGRL